MQFKSLRCPKCNSTAVHRREMVYKSGTSVYSGNSSNIGFSFGFNRPSNPRAWLGKGSHSGRRQSILAQEAQRFPYLPSFLILFFIVVFCGNPETYSGWVWGWLVFSILLLITAISDHRDFKRQWLCNKCGKAFIPQIFKSKESVHQGLLVKEESKNKLNVIKKNLPRGGVKMTDQKDYTKYLFNGEQYGKGRLVLEVIRKYVTDHLDTSYEKLKSVFPDSLQSDTDIQFSKNQVVFSKIEEIDSANLKRFFDKDEELIKLNNCSILVSREWNLENIQHVISTAKNLGL